MWIGPPTQQKEGYPKGRDKIVIVVSLVYCKQVYATCSDPYLGYHQVSPIKHKLSYFNLVALIWIYIVQFFVALIISKCALKMCI
jgi:hypothetical protein